MKWLEKDFADTLAEEIKRNYKAIYDGTHPNYGVVDDITVNGKTYLMRYGRNMGVHYDFYIYDGDTIITKGDFPAAPVDEEYNVIRFYSNQGATIFEYKL